ISLADGGRWGRRLRNVLAACVDTLVLPARAWLVTRRSRRCARGGDGRAGSRRIACEREACGPVARPRPRRPLLDSRGLACIGDSFLIVGVACARGVRRAGGTHLRAFV